MPRTKHKMSAGLRVLVAAVVGAAGLTVATATGAQAAPAAHTPPSSTHGPCQYTVTPDEPAARPVPLPPDPRHTPDKGKAGVTLATNQGLIPLRLDRAKAPCTVQSFLHLTTHHFYDFTTCHRLTTYSTLKVLQCGDPTATGEGGPGYSYKDELPVGLPPSPTNPTGPGRVYARGVLAMANAGPDTNGSQFFVVYGDSILRPDYSIFGTVNGVGLRTLDKIAAGGLVPFDPTNTDDGTPKLKSEILLALRTPIAW